MTRNPNLAGLTAIMAVLITGVFNALAEVPRPEHPRPDLLRENWMTLNGEWQFEIDKAADGESRGLTYGKDLNGKIIVPFCPESKLSGIGLGNTEKLKNVWYRRTFEPPPAMKGQQIRIHFGGVDYRAWVYLNGQLAGTHVGESVEFQCEIIGFLKNGANEVVVKVLDDMWSGLQPCGKQSFDKSWSCFYTRTIKPLSKPGQGVMNLRQVKLVPQGGQTGLVLPAADAPSAVASAATQMIENETLRVTYDGAAGAFAVAEKPTGKVFLTDGRL